jgi:soluble lytic murein transglycosylase
VWIVAFVIALLGTLFALSGAGDHLRADADPAPPLKAAPGEIAPTDDEDAPDTLHFTLPNLRLPADSPETRCVAALALGALDVCRQIAFEAINSGAQEPSLGRLRYLFVRATTSTDPTAAQIMLETLTPTAHPLAAWAQLRLAELLRDRDPQAALRAADALPSDRRWRARAEALRAVALSRAGRSSEAEKLLREIIAEAPANSSGAPSTMTLAAMLANRSDARARKEAISLYRRVYTRSPLTATGEQARALAVQVLKSLPPAERQSLPALPLEDAFAEAEALYNGRAWDRSLKMYLALEGRVRKNVERTCEARLGQGRAHIAMRKYADGALVMNRVTEGCKDPEIKANAHFQIARAILRQGDPARAVAHYDVVAQIDPGHRLADDALVAASQTLVDMGDKAGARARLEQLLAHPSEGDMRSNARFALAWLERGEGNLDASLAELEKLIAEGPGETSEDLFGRADYWHARTLLDLGKREQAAAELAQLFRSRPLTYYSQQAMARLSSVDPKAATALLDDLRDESRPRPARFAVRPELKGPEFERAVELLRVGEPTRATEELTALGMFDRKADDDFFFLGAALLQEFGAQTQATTLARRRVGTIMRSAPTGYVRGLWRVAFPRAFSPMLDDIARNTQVPAAFVRAVAREESSFDPNAVSSANAYGLIQLISSTAKAYAKPLGLPHDPASLKNPENNLRIGTSFMRELFSRYAANPAVVPAAYNAGNGAADRWLRERPNLALDEWIEMIPYAETRRYTKRVLQTYGVYAWLDEQRLPPLPARLPMLPGQVAPADAKTVTLVTPDASP